MGISDNPTKPYKYGGDIPGFYCERTFADQAHVPIIYPSVLLIRLLKGYNFEVYKSTSKSLQLKIATGAIVLEATSS